MTIPTPQYPLMAHMIPCYPNRAASFQVAQGILEGGAAYLEIQFPFSDPMADGPVIEQACQKAIRQGFTVDDGFRFVAECNAWAKQQLPRHPLLQQAVPIFIMSYASIVFACGVETFIQEAKTAGASGLIIPDLPPDSDEGLYTAGTQAGLHIIPVIVPFTSAKRLSMIQALNPAYLYCALRSGITGSKTELTSETITFLQQVSAGRTTKILGGFGITTPEQVQALAPFVHASIVGSQLVRTIDSAVSKGDSNNGIQAAVRDFIKALCG